jgi:hypothetical protein
VYFYGNYNNGSTMSGSFGMIGAIYFITKKKIFGVKGAVSFGD